MRIINQNSEFQWEVELSEQFLIRQTKRKKLLIDGYEPYPVNIPNTHSFDEIKKKYSDLISGFRTKNIVNITGRVVFSRDSGKLCFSTIQNGNGIKLQVMLSLNELGKKLLEAWKDYVDLGDIVYLNGKVVKSRRGELSILAKSWKMASKSLNPLPVIYKEIKESTRVRKRYLDLIIRPEAREIALKRVAVVKAIRLSLERRGFIEVETPMLQTIPGGATARPFVTHSNALSTDLYLRIAPELFLKRCIIGGFERVFELNRNFRNEGIDSTHAPEFSMLETYQAYSDYSDSALTIQTLIQEVAKESIGTLRINLAGGSLYDLNGNWKTLDLYSSLSSFIGEEITPNTQVEHLKSIIHKIGLKYINYINYDHGKLVELLWENTVGNKIWSPTFVRNFPMDTSPFARSHRNRPNIVEKWDLYIRGFELATGYSELIDPIIQRKRLVNQLNIALQKECISSKNIDEEFLLALKYGMPPTAGIGMGVDRLLVALTGVSIKETLLFPIVRRKNF